MKRILMITVLAVCMLGAASAWALTFQMADEPDGRTTFLYRFQKPSFDSDTDPDFLTGYHMFAAHLALSRSSALVIELPLGHAKFEGLDDPDGNWAIGNVYLGLHRDGLGSRGKLSLNLGAFVPTAQSDKDNASFVGYLSDFQHMGRFFPDVLTIHADLGADFDMEGGMYVRTEVGPDFMVPVGDNDGDADLLMRYGIGIGLRQDAVELGIEFAGNWLATSDGASFSEASFHMLSVGAEYKGAVISPSIYISKPTDEDFDIVNWLLGVRLKVRMG